MADFAGVMSRQGISRGSAGRSPGKPETTRLGKRVGSTKDHTESRNISSRLKATKKGHKRVNVRPVHQGASKSYSKLTPPARGANRFSFGTIANG